MTDAGSLSLFQSAPSDWGRTEIQVETKRTQRLPLSDIGMRSIGRPDQKFRIELGRACFY